MFLEDNKKEDNINFTEESDCILFWDINKLEEYFKSYSIRLEKKKKRKVRWRKRRLANNYVFIN